MANVTTIKEALFENANNSQLIQQTVDSLIDTIHRINRTITDPTFNFYMGYEENNIHDCFKPYLRSAQSVEGYRDVADINLIMLNVHIAFARKVAESLRTRLNTAAGAAKYSTLITDLTIDGPQRRVGFSVLCIFLSVFPHYQPQSSLDGNSKEIHDADTYDKYHNSTQFNQTEVIQHGVGSWIAVESPDYTR